MNSIFKNQGPTPVKKGSMFVKKLITPIMTLTLILCLGFSVALAGEKADTAFYQNCIMDKALKCEQKARTISGASHKEVMAEATTARDQAAFYRDCKDILVERMASCQVASQRHCVEHYLIKAYHDKSVRQEIAQAARAKMALHTGDNLSGPVTQ